MAVGKVKMVKLREAESWSYHSEHTVVEDKKNIKNKKKGKNNKKEQI